MGGKKHAKCINVKHKYVENVHFIYLFILIQFLFIYFLFKIIYLLI